MSWKDKTFAIVIICLIIGSLLNVSETTAISSEDSSLLPEEEEVLPYVKLYAGEYGIDPALVMAIISKESRFTSEAKGDIIPPDFRFKDIIEYTAFGYMQVRWPAAYDAGFRGTIVPIEGEIKERYDWFYTYCYSIWTVQPTDEKFFAYLDWPNHGTNPDENIRYGTGYLGWIRDRIVNGIFPNPYNNMLKSTISRYNPRAGDPYVEEVFRYCKKYAVKLGLYRLEEYQNPYDGSWSNSVGVTSLATLAFLNAGYDERDPTVKKAIQYILAHRNPDGSFGKGTYETYETSTAVWALVATHNPDYYDEINAAKDWLIKAQSDEEDGTPPDDPCYGGWRYEISSRDGDLSNAQFALMALDAAYTELGSKLGLQKPDPNDPNGWAFKAIKFISRCQNRPASNDQPWAHDITQPSYNDGGFIYHPRGRSLAGGTKSYGSMTAAGIWSLRLCGVDVTDGRIQEGLKWLAKNEDCSFDDNPGRPYDQPHCFLYYYYLTLAKALTMCFRQKLGEVDWYTALSTKLIDLQCNDGHWVNAPASHGGEDNPDLTTSYAILSLQVRQIPTEIKSLSWLTIILRSNADLHVYDPFGRYVGKNYETGKIEMQIPNATYIYEEFQNITIPELEGGNYRIVLVGTGTGSYNLNVTGGVGDTMVSKYSYTRSITKGEVHGSVVDVAMITWLTIHVEEPNPVEAMVRSSTGTGNVSFISDAGIIESLAALSESDLPAEGKPALSFPHGFFSFTITGLAMGQTVNVTIAFPSNLPVTAQYWKYHTPEGWHQIPIRSNDGDNIIIIQLTDGGIGDDDGVANGVIVDVGGPGVPVSPVYVPKPLVGGILTLVILAPYLALIGLAAVVAVAFKRRGR